MNETKNREKRMYFINDSEYISFPLKVTCKTHPYYTTNSRINQLVFDKYSQLRVK